MKRSIPFLFVLLFFISVSAKADDFDIQKLKDASVRMLTSSIIEKCPDCGKKHGIAGYSSGTIIKSVFNWENNYTHYVVTASHVVGPSDKITVEVFANNESYGSCEGRLLLRSGNKSGDSDVALVKFDSYKSFSTVSLAAADYAPKIDDVVVHIGCPYGTTPPKSLNTDMKIVAIDDDAYKIGSTIACDKMPVIGRSGGGLFNKKGELIGVCVMIDPVSKRGVYCSWKEVIKLVQGTEYEFLVK